MSSQEDFDAFKQAIMEKIDNAISHFGKSPTTDALTSAASIVFGAIPQIEDQYQKSVKASKEAIQDRDETVRLHAELALAGKQLQDDCRRQEAEHRERMDTLKASLDNLTADCNSFTSASEKLRHSLAAINTKYMNLVAADPKADHSPDEFVANPRSLRKDSLEKELATKTAADTDTQAAIFGLNSISEKVFMELDNPPTCSNSQCAEKLQVLKEVEADSEKYSGYLYQIFDALKISLPNSDDEEGADTYRTVSKISQVESMVSEVLKRTAQIKSTRSLRAPEPRRSQRLRTPRNQHETDLSSSVSERSAKRKRTNGDLTSTYADFMNPAPSVYNQWNSDQRIWHSVTTTMAQMIPHSFPEDCFDNYVEFAASQIFLLLLGNTLWSDRRVSPFKLFTERHSGDNDGSWYCLDTICQKGVEIIDNRAGCSSCRKSHEPCVQVAMVEGKVMFRYSETPSLPKTAFIEVEPAG